MGDLEARFTPSVDNRRILRARRLLLTAGSRGLSVYLSAEHETGDVDVVLCLTEEADLTDAQYAALCRHTEDLHDEIIDVATNEPADADNVAVVSEAFRRVIDLCDEDGVAM